MPIPTIVLGSATATYCQSMISCFIRLKGTITSEWVFESSLLFITTMDSLAIDAGVIILDFERHLLPPFIHIIALLLLVLVVPLHSAGSGSCLRCPFFVVVFRCLAGQALSVVMSFTECCSPELGVDFASSLTISNPIADPVEVPFRFRDLPKELRFMVYEHTLSFNSIDKYCSDYLELLCTTSDTREPVPHVEKACPSILLVSKDITEEALPILYKTPLNLSCGIFKAHLQDLIVPDLLRNLRYINLSDSGTRHLITPPHHCFSGLCYAVVELAAILRPGHSLKSLTLDYTSPYLAVHLKDCLHNNDKNCGIKSWSKNLLRSIKELHNVEKVSLNIEWTEDVKKEVVQSVKGPALGLLSLPLNVRQKIYGYAADPNDGARALRRATKDLAL
jgi:hypothetical protein